MINTSPRFQRTLAMPKDPVSELQHWEDANDAFDKKEYKKSLFELINYINPNLLKKEDLDKDISIVQGQGSVNVHINIADDKCDIKVPFLKITDKTNRVALLRKISEVNFNDLMLSQIRLKDDILQFEFSEALELCHPHKLLGVIREVAIYADDYDDEFVKRYGADFLQKAKAKELSADEKKKINEYLDQILEDYQKYSKAFKKKRLDDFQWDIILVSILKLGIMPYINGTFRTDLREYIYNMLDLDIDFSYRLDKGVNFMNKLINTDREELMADMYYSTQMVSLKRRCNFQILKDAIRTHDNIIQQYDNKKEHIALFYILQITFLRTIFRFNIKHKYITAILDVLEKSAGIDIKEASKMLLDLYNKILDGEIEEDKQEKPNFFERLLKKLKIKS